MFKVLVLLIEQNCTTTTDLANPILTFIVYMPLLKNLQFLPNDYEIWSKLSTHEYFIMT